MFFKLNVVFQLSIFLFCFEFSVSSSRFFNNGTEFESKVLNWRLRKSFADDNPMSSGVFQWSKRELNGPLDFIMSLLLSVQPSLSGHFLYVVWTASDML